MDQKRIWDYYQGEAVHSFDNNAPRLKYLLSLLGENDVKILNIGIGNGKFEVLCKTSGKDVYALDPSEEAVANLSARLALDGKVKVGSSQHIPFDDGYFDVVVMSEVLEHLSDDLLDQTLADVSRVLRPTGRFIGTVPAKEIIENHKIMCPDCGAKFHPWGHEQEFDEARLRRVLQHKFPHVMVRTRYFPSFAGLNWKGKIFAAIKQALGLLGIHGGNENLVFVAEKLLVKK